MKQITLSLLLLILISCTTTKQTHYPKQIFFFGFDFRPFTEKGFLFTPEKYVSPYESIGLITCVITPEEKLVPPITEEQEKLAKIEDIYYGRTQDIIWITENIEPEEVLQTIYDECIKMGADALVNFKYDTIELPSRNSIFEYETKFYIVSGFAIKRL